MSKGLGYLQREILQTLDQARDEEFYYTGSCRINPDDWINERWNKAGWVVVRKRKIRIKEGVYDLRASLQFLGKRLNKTSGRGFIPIKFQASFSRAVKGLIKKGLLKKCWLLPIDDAGDLDMQKAMNILEQDRIMLLADGLYFDSDIWGKQQIRFVVKPDSKWDL